jgi:hypothetical protein
MIRFPKPGHTGTSLRDEKVSNVVRFMKFLAQRTTIPLPRVVSWGLTEESPLQLGPFIIMDFVEELRLSTLLKRPTETDQDEVVLNPDIDDSILDSIYDQIAGYLLQLSRLDFTGIGAISKAHDSNTWSVTGRPLTYNMNELATVSGYPTDKFPTTKFLSAKEYFQNLAIEHLIHYVPSVISRTILKTPRDGSLPAINLNSLFQNSASKKPARSNCSAMICNPRICSWTQKHYKSLLY